MAEMKKTGSLTPKRHKLAADTRRKFEAKRQALRDQLLHVHIRDAAVDQVHHDNLIKHHETHGTSPSLRSQLAFLVAEKSKVQHAEKVVLEQLQLVDNVLKAN